MNNEKENIVSDAATVATFSMRILLCVVLMGWLMWMVDPTQAYQHPEHFSRRMFARLPKELRYKLRGWLIRILKPVYGLKDSGSYWFWHHLRIWIAIGMISTAVDPCLLHRRKT